MGNELLTAALEYAARGFHVFPIWGITDGRCNCPKGAACDDTGKHPLTAPGLYNGLLGSTTDAARIESWWRRWPNANIGLRTGAISGVWVLDIDVGHGGDESLAALEREHGALPDTAEVLTGGGGRHLFWKHPGGKVVTSTKTCNGLPGIDSRGDGGYVVAPPSLHKSGRRYEWEVSAHAIVDAPAWLIAMVTKEKWPAPTRGKRISPEKVTPNAALLEVAASLTANSDIAALAAGVDVGSRHTDGTRLVGSLYGQGYPQERVAEMMKAWCAKCAPVANEKEILRLVADIGDMHRASDVRRAHGIVSDNAITTILTGGPAPRPPARMSMTGDHRKAVLAALEVKLGVPITQVRLVSGDAQALELFFGDLGTAVMSGADLLSPSAFRAKVLFCCRMVAKRHKADAWDRIVQEIVDVAEELDAGEEATERGETWGWVAGYVAAVNNPYVVSEGRLWIQFEKLVFMLSVRGVPIGSKMLAQRLARYGAEKRVSASENVNGVRRFTKSKTRRQRWLGIPKDDIEPFIENPRLFDTDLYDGGDTRNAENHAGQG